MWKKFYSLFSPKYFYEVSESWIKPLALMAFFCLLIASLWGLFYSPADYLQGDVFRIIYVHVPCAFLSLSLYLLLGFFALLTLVWQLKIAGMILPILAELGTYMTLLALITGSIWGKPTWGTWWVWDARLSSELILFFLYASVWALAKAFEGRHQAEKTIAILALVGLVDLPIIHYSVYWWNTLHQGASLGLFMKPKIAWTMLYPLLMSLAGFFAFAALSIVLKLRNHVLLFERKQSWVKSIILQDLK